MSKEQFLAKYPKTYDVIVVGGGHAGTEAALAAARLGAKTLLLTHNLETVGQMSCNPAIGGIGKGHLVKEVDALGGVMALAADEAGIQFRTLNASKGPAVRATRAQCDRTLYKAVIRRFIEQQPHLDVLQQPVEDLMTAKDGGLVEGVLTETRIAIRSKTVVLTAGTFLAGRMHVGLQQAMGGRAGDPASTKLSERLRALPFRIGRLKTGTPPRLDGRTIRWSDLEQQPGDHPTPVFSLWGSRALHPPQIVCHITETNAVTHELIRASLDRSPLFNGQIEGTGPRYCPSIEDKVVRFAHKSSHPIFLEPEGLNTYEVYPNGISTSLPVDVQWDLIHSIKGLESAHVIRPGYAIEYDYFDPRDLTASLESRCMQNLFLAGQVNGTTGYEEAAGQGILAGINAALRAQGKPSWTLGRQESYIGVLVDDLRTLGTTEPYRMFTSRAEHRLLLREDNADLRLCEKAQALGLLTAAQWATFCKKRESIALERERLKNTWIKPNGLAFQAFNERYPEQPLEREFTAEELLRRPEVQYRDLIALPGLGPAVSEEVVSQQVEIQIKYAGYIERQTQEINRMQKYEQLLIPQELDYTTIPGLSTEIVEKLVRVRPSTLGLAARIAGVTPAAVSLILAYALRVKQPVMGLK